MLVSVARCARRSPNFWVLARPVTARGFTTSRHFYSKKNTDFDAISSSSSSSTPESPLSSAADYLTGLGLGDGSASREVADEEAKAWLEALNEVKQELKPDGNYRPSEVFAPSGSQDYNILKDVPADTKAQFEPTPAQAAKLETLKAKDVPPMFDETMEYLASVVMRHGKKARARRYLGEALYLVYLKTRQDPVAQLKKALEEMAPLVRLKRFSDGGARTEMVPRTLTERQRLRQAWDWVLEGSDKRPSKAFSVRLSDEILAAIEGRGAGFEKKVQQHKAAITNRAYIALLNK